MLDMVLAQQRILNRAAALQTDLVGRADQACAYLDDGTATLAAWLRSRTLLDAGECSRRVTLRSPPRPGSGASRGWPPRHAPARSRRRT